MKNPTTAQEWQQAVDAAEAWLVMDSAKSCGLIAGGPRIDVERCEEILGEGKRLGFYPKDRVIELVKELKEAGTVKTL
jgi:glycine/serine hydroxymethyltransferase